MSDYYNLEKAAEVLGRTPGDLNRLRESGKIRAFRDGSTWKFRKEDIDGFLTDEIKARSSSLGDDDDDLLNDTDDEEMPTMMAETNTFDLDANVEIKARNIGEAEVTVADGDDDDDYVLGGNTNDHQPGSSSISLDADDDDFDDFASGISILDETSGSSPDLDSDMGVSLGGSNSGSGISILEEDDEEPEPQREQPQDDFELDDLQLDPLPSENEPSSTASDKNFDQPAPVTDEQYDEDVHELQMLDEPEEASSSSGDTYGIAGDSGSDTETRELETIDDFDLTPTDQDESDSESSSQMIDIDEETQSVLIDEAAGQTAGGIDLSKESKEETDGTSSRFGAETEENFFDDGSFNNGDEFGEYGSFGSGENADSNFSDPDFQPVDGGGTSDFDENHFEADTADYQTAESSSEPQRIASDSSGYSGLAIWLALVPCILLLILSGIGIWELVRSMWSWEQPFSITGPVLETIGNMFKLFN